MAAFGDFNVVINGKLDRSKVGSAHSLIPSRFKTWLDANEFIDVWRNAFPGRKEYIRTATIAILGYTIYFRQ